METVRLAMSAIHPKFERQAMCAKEVDGWT